MACVKSVRWALREIRQSSIQGKAISLRSEVVQQLDCDCRRLNVPHKSDMSGTNLSLCRIGSLCRSGMDSLPEIEFTGQFVGLNI